MMWNECSGHHRWTSLSTYNIRGLPLIIHSACFVCSCCLEQSAIDTLSCSMSVVSDVDGPFGVIIADANQVITSVNQTFTELTGYSAEVRTHTRIHACIHTLERTCRRVLYYTYMYASHAHVQTCTNVYIPSNLPRCLHTGNLYLP